MPYLKLIGGVTSDVAQADSCCSIPPQSKVFCENNLSKTGDEKGTIWMHVLHNSEHYKK